MSKPNEVFKEFNKRHGIREDPLTPLHKPGKVTVGSTYGMSKEQLIKEQVEAIRNESNRGDKKNE